jgi:hypothetical protein
MSDVETLTDRLRRERLVLVETPDDGPLVGYPQLLLRLGHPQLDRDKEM